MTKDEQMKGDEPTPNDAEQVARQCDAIAATSASAGKSRKQRRESNGDGSPRPSPPGGAHQKALEYQLIDLMKTDGIGQEEQNAIWTLVRFLTAQPK